MNWICLKCGEMCDYVYYNASCNRCGWIRPQRESKEPISESAKESKT